LAGWLADLAAACGKMGADLTILTRSEIAEVALPGAGASSTMPQKQNPVAPSLLLALARFAPAQAAVLQGAAVHAEARDGAAWFAEWLTLPPLVTASPPRHRGDGRSGEGLEVRADAMARPSRRPAGPDPCRGAVLCACAHAWARPRRRRGQGAGRGPAKPATPLPELVARAHPGHGPARPHRPAMLGTAPQAARAFARAARAGGRHCGCAKELSPGIVKPVVSI
jgi:3-carboxy-cis,cis-muconate cycloisomerase